MKFGVFPVKIIGNNKKKLLLLGKIFWGAKTSPPPRSLRHCKFQIILKTYVYYYVIDLSIKNKTEKRRASYFCKNKKYRPLEIEKKILFGYFISESPYFSYMLFFQKMLNVSSEHSFKKTQIQVYHHRVANLQRNKKWYSKYDQT